MPVYKFTGTYRVEFWEEEIEADNQEDAERELECRAEQRMEREEPLQIEVVEDDGAGEEAGDKELSVDDLVMVSGVTSVNGSRVPDGQYRVSSIDDETCYIVGDNAGYLVRQKDIRSVP